VVRAAVLVVVVGVLPACSFRVGGVAPDGVTGIGEDAGAPFDEGMPPGDGPALADLAGPPDLRVPGFLSVTSAVSATAVDLTDVGTADWIHWGTNLVTDVDRKSGGGNQISDFSTVPGSSLPTRAGSSPITFSWNDGVGGLGHNATSDGTASSVYVTSGGITFSAPADTARRHLIVYEGLFHSQAQMRITLSDGSAGPYNDTTWQSDAKDAVPVTYTIEYNAASAGQTLTVTWTLVKTLENDGLVGIGSAALTKP
jgi:hypothetical protein